MPTAMYRRNLPHIFPDNVPIFFTWRLAGSLPSTKIRAGMQNETTGERFHRIDNIQGRAATGPKWLSDPLVAKCFAEEIERGADPFHRYELLEYVVMPNHVHMLVLPRIPALELTHLTKGITARRANEVLQRADLPFWQDESFDHYCRSVEELRKIRNYIATDPVRCGLASRPQDWRWSSASRKLAHKRAAPEK